tara:strand:- start:29 stop:463 length:435 start_codon:yes stop_codon:yes gene_type:complete
MDIEGLNFDFKKVSDNTFKEIKQKRKNENIDIKPEMFDYMIGNENPTSLRYEYIKEIECPNKRIEEMTILLSEILPQGLPQEFYEWYARDCLGLQYKKYEIRDMKRKYKIEQKRKIEEKKKQDKIDKQNKKKLQYVKKKTVLEF